MKPKPESEEVVDGIAEDEELHSLTHYAGDEELLVKHMFAAIQHTKLEAMMPPVLKAIPLQDLQLLCIHELRGISKKRIIAIIQGRNMSDSSGSEDEEDEKEEEKLRHASKTASGRRRKASSKTKTSPDPSKPMDIVELEMRARLIQTMLKKDPKNKTIPPLDDIKAQIKSEPLSDRSYSSSRSVSRSRSYSSRSYSRSSSSRRSGSSSCSDSEGRRIKRKSGHRSRRRDRRGRRRKSYRDSSKKRDSSRDDSAATPDKNGSDNKRRQAKKTRISRKEFEDRMRRAKENRTYRKRTDSEDETKTGREKDQSDDGEERSGVAGRSHERAKGPEEMADVEKEPVEDESEKEEGEIDSNEDEETGVYYSGEGSPRRRKSRRSRSFSSISSLSGTDRSRSGRRSKRGQDRKRKRRKEHRMPVDKNLILATLNEENSRTAAQSSKRSKSKTGIEAVDSEEDFDNLGNGKREISRSDANVGLRTDRTNVSFSFNKKTAPSLMSGTDFEFGMSYSAPPPSGPPRTPPLSLSMKKSAAGDQIVISSDSECEEKPTKKARKNTAEKPMFIEDDANDGAVNISDQNDLKLCEETVMKDIFDDMNEDEEEEEQSNDPTTRTDVTIKAEPTDHAENDEDGGSVNVNRSGSSPNVTAGVSVKRELNSPEEMQSVGGLSKRGVETPIAQKETEEQDSEEGACTDEDSNSGGKTIASRSFVNSFQAASDEPTGSGTENRSHIPLGSGPDHKKSNGDVCNGSDEEEEDVGLVDLPEDEHFALDVDDEDTNSQSRYDDTIDPVAEGGDDSEVTADKTDFYRGVENLNVSEDNSLLAPQESQGPVESEHKSESEEEGEIEEDAGLVELEPGEAEELSGMAASTPARAPVRQGGTEIIGEIEPSSKDSAALENLSESGSSWSSRWLQSEKVQKVVTNSKMLSRMRKRIKIDKINAKAGSSAATVGETAVESQKTEENVKDDAMASSSTSVPVINSMEEYKKLLGKADTASDGVGATSGDAVAAAGESEKKDGDDASSDDSDEDLWSKMMGN